VRAQSTNRSAEIRRTAGAWAFGAVLLLLATGLFPSPGGSPGPGVPTARGSPLATLGLPALPRPRAEGAAPAAAAVGRGTSVPGSEGVRPASFEPRPAALWIEGPGPAVDLAVPFTVRAGMPNGTAPLAVEWSDSEGGLAQGLVWTHAVDTTGALIITLVLEFRTTSESTSESVTVVDGPALNLSAPVPSGDVGFPLPARANVSGGVPPYTLAWSLNAGTDRGLVALPGPGTWAVPITSRSAGSVAALLTLNDSAGFSRTEAVVLPPFVPPPHLDPAVPAVLAEVNGSFEVGVAVENGTPPFRWSFAPGPPLVGAPSWANGPNGSRSASWSGSSPRAGNASVQFTVVDAVGATATANATVVVAPSLTVDLGATPATGSPNPTAWLTGFVADGTPPYAWAFVFSNGARMAGNLSRPGTVDANLTGPVGTYSVEFEVEDAAGRRANATAEITLTVDGAHPTLGAGGSGWTATAWGAAGGTVLGSCAATLAFRFLRRWRKRPRGTPVGPRETLDPSDSAVREIFAESASPLDRGTIRFLAEERGVSPADADAALARWIARGRVAVAAGPNGSEELRWSGSDAPSPSSPPSPEATL
jgi:hypothetical protein